MGSRKLVLLLIVFLAVCVGTCRPSDNDVVDETKDKAEEAKKFAAGMVHDAGEKTQSFSDWVQDKFSKSFGFEEDKEKLPTQNMKYNAEAAASRAAGTMKSTASGASDYASEKTKDAMEAVSGAMAQGKEKMYDAYDGDAKVIKMPESIHNAKDTVGVTVGQAREKMGDTYEDAMQKVHKASDKASDKASTMAHNAKDNMDEYIGYGKDTAANAYDEGKQEMNMASEKFYDARDKANDVYDEARHKVKGAMDCGRNKGVDAFDDAKEGMDMAGDKANDAKENIGVTNEYGRDKVAETFDQAKREVDEAYAWAKTTMTQEAKAKYEAAKEKASDAAGDVGAKMRNTPNQ